MKDWKVAEGAARRRVDVSRWAKLEGASPVLLRRIQDALADGLSGRDFRERFGVSVSAARLALRRAVQLGLLEARS